MSVQDTPKRQGAAKRGVIGLLCLIAVGLSAWSIVRQLPPRPKMGVALSHPTGVGYPGGGPQLPGTRGKITAVGADAITVQPRGGAPQTFTLTPATKITVDRAAGTAAALTVGQRARVVSADAKTATEVHIRTRPFGGGPGGGPPPPGGGQ